IVILLSKSHLLVKHLVALVHPSVARRFHAGGSVAAGKSATQARARSWNSTTEDTEEHRVKSITSHSLCEPPRSLRFHSFGSFLFASFASLCSTTPRFDLTSKDFFRPAKSPSSC